MYIYMFVPLTRVCVVYVVREVASFQGGRQINGRGCNRTCAQALQTSKKKASLMFSTIFWFWFGFLHK